MGLSYEEGIKKVKQGLLLLAGVTLAEVFISLLGKGHIIEGLEDYQWLFWITGLAMIVLSFYKAYYIIYEFMHMRYEVRGLALTVLLPTLLLVWAIIAFLWEGEAWKDRREEYNVEQAVEVHDATDEKQLDMHHQDDHHDEGQHGGEHDHSNHEEH